MLVGSWEHRCNWASLLWVGRVSQCRLMLIQPPWWHYLLNRLTCNWTDSQSVISDVSYLDKIQEGCKTVVCVCVFLILFLLTTLSWTLLIILKFILKFFLFNDVVVSCVRRVFWCLALVNAPVWTNVARIYAVNVNCALHHLVTKFAIKNSKCCDATL